MKERLLEVLRQGFGHSSFRQGQAEMIERVMAGRNVLGLLSTGGGKSVTYQLPALLLPGLVLVVSPLISLMMDQVQKLRARRVIPAAYMNSAMDPGEVKQIMTEIEHGKFKLLYISPEKLQQRFVQRVLAARGVSLVAIDEAHCISQWGHDFRTDYMRLPEVISRLGNPTVLAVTATATPAVREEICRLFTIAPEDVVIQPLNRNNIAMDVIPVGSEAERRERVIHAMEVLKGPGIVYCGTRQAVETLTEQYRLTGQKNVHAYHGGMNGMERALIQQQFLRGDLDIIVATNAFGMGIDKPDIRFVLHYHFPASLEAYAQEIGRVGRDGLPGYAGLFFTPDDLQIHMHLLEREYPTDTQVAVFLRELSKGSLSCADLAARGEIGPDMVQLLMFYAEQAGMISEAAATSEGFLFTPGTMEGNEHGAASRILERIERVKRRKLEKLQHMIRWLHASECLRSALVRYYGESGHTEYVVSCCSRCGMDRSRYEQDVPEDLRLVKKEWDLEQALRTLLPKKMERGGR